MFEQPRWLQCSDHRLLQRRVKNAWSRGSSPKHKKIRKMGIKSDVAVDNPVSVLLLRGVVMLLKKRDQDILHQML
ncbi:hypothetical protein AOLI_G00276540 [Acnodon oligacanthus]